METKHTPGPWIINERVTNFEVTISTEDDTRICQVKSFDKPKFNDPTVEEANYNAKLIAAAPELLEAVIKIKNQLKGIEVMDLTKIEKNTLEACQNAIKKATE